MKLYLALANEGGGYVFKNRTPEQLMDIYLAGYNYKKHACDSLINDMKIDLAGQFPFDEKQKGTVSMDVYLAGVQGEKKRANTDNDFAQKIYILESFYYINEWMIPYIKNHWNFLLDSGAFTFMSNKKNVLDWDDYLERYAAFINEYNIELFFELDIDSVVGIKEVERLRDKLHTITGKKSIPVWHKSRGLDYWINMCKEYDYVAIGGIVSGEIRRKDFNVFHKLISIAKEHNSKVHGLGFTNTIGLEKYKFYSVDSTAWIYGNMGGYIYNFNGKNIEKIKVPFGKRLNGKEAAIHNFKEWVKYQRYAKDNL